jgi:RNA-directed DNA polymerase
MTRRNRGASLRQVIGELNRFLCGWLAYFRYAECKSHLSAMDQWVRRRLRCLRLKACKRSKAIADFLRRLGVPERRSWPLALSGKGWWRLAGSPPATEGMSLAWFDSQGLVSLLQRYEQLNR